MMNIFPERSTKGIGLAALRILLLTYFAFGVLLYLRQNDFLFFPPTTPMEECADLPSAQIVTMENTRAYYIESGSSTKIAIIYHGNGERACDSAYLVNWLSHYGYNSLVVEYAGYAGDRSQKPSVALLLHDVEHVNTWVRGRNFSQLLIIGRSIGTGFASYHASLASPEKLLLISPFDRLSQTVQEHYPIYPASLLLKTELDNVSTASFGKKVLIIHGTEDASIPIDRARSLFEKLPQEQKIFVPVEGHAHNDVLGTKESWAAIVSFLK